MPPSRIRKSLPQRAPKAREGMSASHLAMVRWKPCCVCGVPAHHAHHLLRTGEHGMGKKSSDRWCVPMCNTHHQALHSHGDEEAFLMSHGIDGRALASALWAARGDQEAMERVVFRFRQEARLKKGNAA